MCVYHAICICSYILAQPTFLALYLSIQISSNVSLAMPLTLNAIVLHQDSHAIVLGQGPKTHKPRVQKRPAGAVMKKPAAGSVTPATGSASIAKRSIANKSAAGIAKAASGNANIVKRPSAKVLNKPAAGSAARYCVSTSTIVLSGSSIDDDTTLSALASSPRIASQNRAPWGRTLTVRTTEPYELEPGVDYSSAGTPSSTLSFEMDEQLRLMGWARS